jgi:hypothetical protein
MEALMCPVVENSPETARQPKPVETVPVKQAADECEPRLLRVYDHPRPASVYDDMTTCG